MDKTQGFFDPYNFNLQNSNIQNSQAQNIPQTQAMPGMEVQQMVSPNMYYEQQYMYYKYLTQMIEYKIKLKEWENMNRKEFTLTGSWMSYSAPFPGHEWDLTSHYFSTGELKFDDSFVFEKVPLSKIADAFEWYKTPGKVKGKILVDSEK